MLLLDHKCGRGYLFEENVNLDELTVISFKNASDRWVSQCVFTKVVQIGPPYQTVFLPQRKVFKFRPPNEVFSNPEKINGTYFFTESSPIDACATKLWLCKRVPENEANMPCRPRMPIMPTVQRRLI